MAGAVVGAATLLATVACADDSDRAEETDQRVVDLGESAGADDLDCQLIEAPPSAPAPRSADAGISKGATDTPTWSTFGPKSIYFLADSWEDAEMIARRWWELRDAEDGVIEFAPGPFDLEPLLSLTGVDLMAALSGTSLVCDGGSAVAFRIAPEVVAAVAALQPDLIDDAAQVWADLGIAWHGEGTDNTDGIAILAEFMSGAVAAGTDVYALTAL